MSSNHGDGEAIAASLAEPRAFGVIFERHFSAILRYLRRRLGPEGQGRYREVPGPLQFWSSEAEGRWKAAGSPLPPPFNPEYQQLYQGSGGAVTRVYRP